VNPEWFLGLVFLLLSAPAQIYVGLLYRNWPTGIRLDETAISIGAIASSRAESRTPTVLHQSWGLFTCPRSAVRSARVVTEPAEVRRLKTAPLYYTLTNRWGSKRDMTYCNLGVLTSPFMRAALVTDVDPDAVTAPRARPARMFSNGKDGHLSRLIPPALSPTWIAHPPPGRPPPGSGRPGRPGSAGLT
jgi:hypothetical protein